MISLLGTHQFKPNKYSVYLNYYDEKLKERVVPNFPKSWKEMNMELDIISLSFPKRAGQESIKYRKKKRVLAAKRMNYLLKKNPDLKRINLTSNQKEAIEKIKLIPVTKNTNFTHKDFDCRDNTIETLMLNRKWGDNFLEGSMYELPECIKGFKKLKTISFSNHEINKIPEFLANNKALEIIALPKNKLFELPKNLGEFSALKELDVSDNFILNLSEAMTFPQNIEKINFANNYLTKIPKQLFKLKHLRELNLKGNRIPKKELEKMQKKMKACIISF